MATLPRVHRYCRDWRRRGRLRNYSELTKLLTRQPLYDYYNVLGIVFRVLRRLCELSIATTVDIDVSIYFFRHISFHTQLIALKYSTAFHNESLEKST